MSVPGEPFGNGATNRLDLGYYFHPGHFPNGPGHPRLDIVMRDMPTERHYDPEEVRLTVRSKPKGIDLLTVCHPWRWATHYHACAGFVSLRDRNDEAIMAYTLGGALEVSPGDSSTACTLTSPAPIIRVIPDPRTGGPTVETMLVDKIEALIARRRAVWGQTHDPETFDQRLATVDPLTLYLALLKAMQERSAHFPDEAEDELTRQFGRFLDTEIRALHTRGIWPPYVPSLVRLL